jgi:hypothetical protein
LPRLPNDTNCSRYADAHARNTHAAYASNPEPGHAYAWHRPGHADAGGTNAHARSANADARNTYAAHAGDTRSRHANAHAKYAKHGRIL